jgi:uncharacterized membrane protein YbhN (UPF0104 family)
MLRRWERWAPHPIRSRPSPDARTEWLRGRLISLVVAAVGLYLVWPAPPETVDAWPHLSTIKVRWFVGIVGAHPRPSLVLLAYLSGAILGMVPITPGGLGFVEAG